MRLDIDGTVKQHRKSHTEYHTAIGSYDSRGWVIVLTKWKDLGCGPDCEIWEEHHGLGISSRIRECFPNIRIDDAASQPSSSPVRSIARTFEDGNSSKFETLLTTENKDKLFRTRERWRMHTT